MTKTIKTYSELIKNNSFEERVKYLELKSKVGEDTFGFDRYINQAFYASSEWKKIRNFVITRDCGCDLGLSDREILGKKIIVHHMNPISIEDIENSTEFLLNPEYLITISENTHKLIHYGINTENNRLIIERKPNDTCP